MLSRSFQPADPAVRDEGQVQHQSKSRILSRNDAAISNWFANQLKIEAPDFRAFGGKLIQALRYGENFARTTQAIYYGETVQLNNVRATFHPAGFTHGPHPKAFAAGQAYAKKFTDEVAVMYAGEVVEQAPAAAADDPQLPGAGEAQAHPGEAGGEAVEDPVAPGGGEVAVGGGGDGGGGHGGSSLLGEHRSRFEEQCSPKLPPCQEQCSRNVR